MHVAVSPGAIAVQPAIGERPPAWRHPDQAGTESGHIRVLLGDAVAALRALFDGGCEEANAALAGQGRAGRIAYHPSGTERRYCAGDSATDPRFVYLFVLVPAFDEHLFGGAYINSSRTSPSIYLVPCIDGDAACWTVNATGTPFTAQVVRDLFAGVFGDDAAAGWRIAPLAGYDLFWTPWS